jgi:hypothetical protein
VRFLTFALAFLLPAAALALEDDVQNIFQCKNAKNNMEIQAADTCENAILQYVIERKNTRDTAPIAHYFYAELKEFENKNVQFSAKNSEDAKAEERVLPSDQELFLKHLTQWLYIDAASKRGHESDPGYACGDYDTIDELKDAALHSNYGGTAWVYHDGEDFLIFIPMCNGASNQIYSAVRLHHAKDGTTHMVKLVAEYVDEQAPSPQKVKITRPYFYLHEFPPYYDEKHHQFAFESGDSATSHDVFYYRLEGNIFRLQKLVEISFEPKEMHKTLYQREH